MCKENSRLATGYKSYPETAGKFAFPLDELIAVVPSSWFPYMKHQDMAVHYQLELRDSGDRSRDGL